MQYKQHNRRFGEFLLPYFATAFKYLCSKGHHKKSNVSFLKKRGEF